MKKFVLIFSLLAFTSCAFAEGVHVPSYNPGMGVSGTVKETSQPNVEDANNNADQQVSDNTAKKKKRFSFRRIWRSNNGTTPNSYYNFGGTSGYKGRF